MKFEEKMDLIRDRFVTSSYMMAGILETLSVLPSVEYLHPIIKSAIDLHAEIRADRQAAIDEQCEAIATANLNYKLDSMFGADRWKA